MKKLVLFTVLALSGAMFLTGCNKKEAADDNKTVEQIKAEAATMTPEQVQAKVAEYQKKIEAKAAEVKKAAEELKAIPLTEQLGDKAKGIQEKIAKLTKELNELKDKAAAYTSAQAPAKK